VGSTESVDIDLKLKVAIVSVLLLASAGCVVVGGYSSNRGWFIWPGSIVLILLGLLLFVLMLRRRG
jgi:hypothetical protein